MRYGCTHSDEDTLANALGSGDGSFYLRDYVCDRTIEQLVPLQRHINRFIDMLNDGKSGSIDEVNRLQRLVDRLDSGPNTHRLSFLDEDSDNFHAYEYHKAPQEVVDILHGLDVAWREAKKTFDALKKQLSEAIDRADKKDAERERQEQEVKFQRLEQKSLQTQREYRKKWSQIEVTHTDVRKGIVYLLTNELMPGMVKIGFIAGNPDKRALEISEQYALPSPFLVTGYIRTKDPYIVEQRIHTSLEDCRVKGEFFKINSNEALKVIRKHIIS